MATKILRIATRQSALAMWQAHFVKDALEASNPDLEVVLLTFLTKGDILLDTPLSKVGGKGLFVKELENAMLAGDADIAVHSMKDVPMAFPEGLGLATICERGDPRDAFVSNKYASIEDLPQGAIVGTSSLRRQCQLRASRPDLIVNDLRGNVNTRLSKLDAGEYDAIILAAAGLLRLEMPERIASYISPEQSLPAVGQGAVGIECRLDDKDTLALLEPLNHPDTRIRVLAERAVNNTLEGGCQVPIGSYALLEGDQIYLRALVGSPDGSTILFREMRGPSADAEKIGVELANALLDAGAKEILDKVYQSV